MKIYVDGKPRPKSRARFVGGVVVSTANKRERTYKQHIQSAAAKAWRGAPALTDACRVDLTFWFATTKAARWNTPHTHKPDKDNLEKGCLDALVRAGVLRDDSLVSEGTTRKLWSDKFGLLIEIGLPGGAAPLADEEDVGAVALEG